MLYKKVEIPRALLAREQVDGKGLVFGGDIRIGDLTGDGEVDFLVYRSVDKAHDVGGMKPCFIGAFDMNGVVLWRVGGGGEQPCRPGPVAIHDIDGDGSDEVITFFHDGKIETPPTSMADVVVQIRDGKSGALECQAAPAELTSCQGSGPNWCHQRLLMADLRGCKSPRDFVVKLGSRVLAFDEKLRVLWTYEINWNEYGKCSAYIPSVGDIDGDGKDEVNGGYYLLDSDGSVLWERQLGDHMDSVAIAEWDSGRKRAICSGFGHVMDEQGNVVLRLGPELVPHGQEVRVGRFDEKDPEPQMVIRWNGHTTEVILVNIKGEVISRFELNSTPNNTGMEMVYWHGETRAALLCNGEKIWQPLTAAHVILPCLAKPVGSHRAGWYHCIPADVCGDSREEVILYNPWDSVVYIFTPSPLKEDAFAGYRPGPRQYNARLMD
jgi:hypothetical protein